MAENNMKPSLLNEIAERRETVKIQVPLSVEEKETLNKDFLEQSFQQATLEEELRELSAVYKAKIKEIKKTNRDRMKDLRLGYRETEDSCYLVADQDEGVMRTYSSEGLFVSQRPLFPQERQANIFQLKKEGTTE